ncbi:hypothetical protein A2W45_01915 [Candidatus Curtissbacteria bacterium RIFCSPHIGHO2_12_41_11]|uniref:Uncharacterized protein n=3 Tax=Candidatus Curtissiibacteriota TaxID=1752717 RepID=A0A1F5HTA5_9BACT|nr:MAG: hypothetical protein UU56_C0008G0063 [Candidatus Curtissbacteria bacterium GW2011_GWA2_41_24]OGD98182.1 MAG: hypothetical protein A2W45_01915 [Candidatus Curtissbacteria bacterium RIFCSPHIGHO2_12_41_11]OGE07384.1 MAG: hypothetical protein A2W70_03265 [Candidatus Curtissbacteria bacterium RIFCSPLOWO2_02_41_11]
MTVENRQEGYLGELRYEDYLGSIPAIEFREDQGGRPPVLRIADSCFEVPEDFLDIKEISSWEEVSKFRERGVKGRLLHPLSYLSLAGLLKRRGILKNEADLDINVEEIESGKFLFSIEPLDIELDFRYRVLEVSGEYAVSDDQTLWDALEKDARERLNLGYLIDYPCLRVKKNPPIIKRIIDGLSRRKGAVG